MKTYKIPCHWRMYGFYFVEAESLQKALEIVEDEPLPRDRDYIETCMTKRIVGSFEIDTEMLSFHNELTEVEKKFE